MAILDKLFRREQIPEEAPDQAVLVHFTYGSTDLSALSSVEESLDRDIGGADVGEFDGNEIATDGSDGTLFMYGPDADALFAAIRPALDAAPFMTGARVILRYGPPGAGATEKTVTLPIVSL